ncbi:hypothetical protein Dimus_004215, partial [Dionaea muscipula]
VGSAADLGQGERGQKEASKPYLEAVQGEKGAGLEETAQKGGLGNRDVIEAQQRRKASGPNQEAVAELGNGSKWGRQGKGGMWIVAKGGPKADVRQIDRKGCGFGMESRFQVLQDEMMMEMDESISIGDPGHVRSREGMDAGSSEVVREKSRPVVPGDHDSWDLEREGLE